MREWLWIAKLRHLNLFVLDFGKFGHDPIFHHIETVVARHSERHNIARVPFLVEVEEGLADTRLRERLEVAAVESAVITLFV